MAFSESLGFGDSTLMKLESQAKHVLNKNDNFVEKDNGTSELESIAESPTEKLSNNNKNITVSKNFIRRNGHLLQNITQNSNIYKNNKNQSKFWRSKSDSKLLKCQMDYNEISSDFFRSNFTFTLEEKYKQESNLKLSKIEAFFENEDKNDIRELMQSQHNIMEQPILSEDLKDIVNNENDSIAGNAVQDCNVAALDVSSFICFPQKNDEMKNENERLIEKELERSHRCLQESGINLDKNASPNKLKLLSEAHIIEANNKKQHKPNNNKTLLNSNLKNLKNIKSWNLPLTVVEAYGRKGVKEMFDWQVECLSNPKVLFDHCNLVYSAPTSAGKTLVSEILLIKTILERNKKVLMILPFISVVREKMFYLQDLLTTAGYRVEGFYGGYNPPGGFDSIQVAICTIEKANSIINKLMEQDKLNEIGCLIVDEIHLISDPGRGYILELLLAKILYMCRRQDLHIQIITMSATLANVELLKKWLDAELYITHYRPVALQEMIKIQDTIYDNQLNILRSITDCYHIPNDAEHVAHLCVETVLENYSVIIFCPSKDWCENLAMQLAQALHCLRKQQNEDYGARLKVILKRHLIDEVKQQLRDIPTGLDSVLDKTITYGCAFHHAGLTTEERDIIEASFKSGALKIIVATSTLSSGVNLPARRVVIRTPMFGGKQMNSLTYRQMIGRAGRTGKDTLGESILICTESNARFGKDLMLADMKPISSCLEMDNNTHLKRALLEVISSGVANTEQEIDLFVRGTLLSTQKHLQQQEKEHNHNESHIDDEDHTIINESLDFLLEYEFIRLQKDEESNQNVYLATRLGMACLSASMPPTDGLILFAELQKSRRCFVLESELHAVYLVTPFSVCYQLQDLDWLLYLDLWEKLSPAMKKVGELVGVKESFLVRAMRGQSKLDYKCLQIHKRFYTALALQELVNETPINVVAHKYKCTRGLLQSLQQMASTFAGIVTSFCHSLQWNTLALIVSQFKERLYFGIHHDLIDLMRLPDLNHKRARALHKNGITTLIELANANKLEIEKILYDSLCFDSNKQYDNENRDEAKQRNEERNLFITGHKGVTVAEAAKLLIEEARLYMQYEIGVNNINWSRNVDDNDVDDMKKETDTLENGHEKLTESKLIVCHLKQDVSLEDNCYTNAYLQMKQESNERKLKFSNDIDEKQCVKLVNNHNNNIDNKNAINNKNKNCEIQSSNVDSKQQQQQQNEKFISPVTALVAKDNKESEKLLNNSVSSNANDHEEQQLQEYKHQSKEDLSCEDKEITPPNKQRQQRQNDGKSAVDVDEKPSTSKKARRLLKARQLSKLKKLEWAKRKSSNELNDNNDSPALKQEQQICDKDNEKETIQVLSRRSPRNHITMKTIKSVKQQNNNVNHQPSEKMENEEKKEGNNAALNQRAKVEKIPKLFNKDENINGKSINGTFPMDSVLDEILKQAEKSDIKQNKINDCEEIPNTQPEAETDDTVKLYSTPYQSHLLRSHRFTQKTPSSPQNKIKSKQVEDKLKEESICQVEAKTELKLERELQFPVESLSNNSTIEFSNISLDNSLLKNPLQLNASHILNCIENENQASSFQSLEIIDICANGKLFKSAFKELMSCKRLAMCIGLQQQLSKRKPLIGGNLLINQIAQQERQQQLEAMETDHINYKYQLDEATYLDGIAFCIMQNIVFYMNMQENDCYRGLTSDIKMHYLKLLLTSADHTILMFEAKDQIKVILKLFSNIHQIKVKFEDAKIANWLLQPDKIYNLSHLVELYAPECCGLINLCGNSRGYNSYGLDATNNILAKIRSSIEACVTLHTLKGLVENLQRIGHGELYKFFKELEMPLQLSLCKMELEGFPTNSEMLHKLFQQIVETMKKLELKIYDLNGGRFNLGSSAAVAKVLGVHRKQNGRITTSKQILEKIDTPISQMIMTYRKLSVTLTKSIQPLLKCIKNERIHGQSITFTATGRISMSEPNLQNVTKDFEVNLIKEKLLISCRQAFQPTDPRRCLLSSDFCQLEMRILTHLCQDVNLLKVMHSDKDIFKSIAAQWNRITESEVTEHLRNATKQLCYGIIYGMGMRSLADSLKCTEQEATLISEQFHNAYPGIRQYMERVIKFAQNNGYVETVTGRRRYLEHINDAEIHIKKQAERQAVNATVQGSAADIVKNAILRVEKNLMKYQDKLGITTDAVKFVLHIHDELLFEIPEDKAKRIAKILSLTMQNCVDLDVPLKVKLKMGKNWGQLKEIKL